MTEVIAPAAAPAAPPPRRPITLSGPVARLVLAFVAGIARGDDAEHAQLAQSVLGRFVAAADRRDARLDARGQLRLDTGARSYPSVPPLRRRRRRPAEPAEAGERGSER